MEDNKKELPFVYNVGDRLKYINGNGETITVSERHRQYDKETDTAKNIYLLTIEDYEGCGYTYQDWASESYMMTYMRRFYSPGKLFNSENFEKKSNDALSCGYYKALEKENKMVNGENEALKRENEELREINEGLACSYENVKGENKTLKAEKERKMMEDSKRESIYKIGDVLTVDNVDDDFHCKYLIVGIDKCDVDVAELRVKNQYNCIAICKGSSFLVSKSENTLVKNAQRIGHIDISLLTGIPDVKPTSGRYKWEVTEDDWPEIKKSLEDTGMIVDTTCGGRFNGKMLIKNLSDENEKLKNETQAMKDELKEMKDKLDLKDHEIDIWKKGWYDCLKSFGYYLNT